MSKALKQQASIKAGDLVIGWSYVVSSGSYSFSTYSKYGFTTYAGDPEELEKYQWFFYLPRHYDWQLLEPPPIKIFLIPTYGFVIKATKTGFLVNWINPQERDEVAFSDFVQLQSVHRLITKALKRKDKTVFEEEFPDGNREAFDGFSMDVVR